MINLLTTGGGINTSGFLFVCQTFTDAVIPQPPKSEDRLHFPATRSDTEYTSESLTGKPGKEGQS